MTEQDEGQSREKTGGDSDILNYARRSTAKTPQKVRGLGIVSFVATLLQIPWWFEIHNFIALMYYDPGPAGVKDPPTPDWIIFTVWLGVFLPMLVGVAFGCYSLKVAGMSWRNPFGVLGLVLVMVLGIWVVVEVCLAVLDGEATLRDVVLGRFFPILILPIAIISVVVWRLIRSPWRLQRP